MLPANPHAFANDQESKCEDATKPWNIIFLYFGPQTTLETHLATVTHPCLVRGGSHNRREMREGPKIYEGCYKMWRDTMEKANHCCLLSKFTQISRQVNPGNTLYLAYIQISGNLRQNTLIENSLQYRCTQHLLQKAAKMLKFVFCFWASRCHRQYRTHFERDAFGAKQRNH